MTERRPFGAAFCVWGQSVTVELRDHPVKLGTGIGAGINAQLRGVIADYQASSRLIRPDGTQTEGTAYVDVPLPAGKRALYGVLRYLVRPIRHLL